MAAFPVWAAFDCLTQINSNQRGTFNKWKTQACLTGTAPGKNSDDDDVDDGVNEHFVGKVSKVFQELILLNSCL